MASPDKILYLLKQDEEEAFRLLFDRYYDNLLLYCYHILNDLEAAEDIIQVCFAELWKSRRLHTFTGNLNRFIFKIVKNQAFLLLRAHKKQTNMQLPLLQMEESGEEEDKEEALEKIELLYRTIDRLPEKCRKIFLAACLNDKTYQEIADEAGISVNTVKTQMKTAFKFLRENLREEDFASFLLFLTIKD